MSPRRPRGRSTARRYRAAALAVVATLGLSACTEVESATVAAYEPAKVTPVKGSDELKQVTFTQEGARRTDLRTERVTTARGREVIPYASLIYDAEGRTYVYTSPRPLTFLREEVRVDRIEDGRVYLREGPAPGMQVVTVGAAEVYGTELEIAASH
jgi:hypothetical protein